MAGPGVDPHYNGTTQEASAWGEAQAKAALSALAAHNPKINYPVVFLDVELPGHAPAYTPAPDNGWNAVYTSPCSGKVRTNYVPAQVDRADFNGFADYLTSHSSYQAGVYSAPSIWQSIFGNGAGRIPNTYEWTYNADTSSLRSPPGRLVPDRHQHVRAVLRRRHAAPVKYALMWQWSGGGGTYNGYGDFDQIDGSRSG